MICSPNRPSWVCVEVRKYRLLYFWWSSRSSTALFPSNATCFLKIFNPSENTTASWGLRTILSSKFPLCQSNEPCLNKLDDTVCLLGHRKGHDFQPLHIFVTITFHPQNSREILENLFKTKIDFNEINILELARNLAISQPSINMSICNAFT